MTSVGVVLAAGSGRRMGASQNKVLLTLAGQPLLTYSVAAFRRCCDQVLVVAAAEEVATVRKLAPGCEVVAGGATRQESEWCALSALKESCEADAVVAIHDAARPLVSERDVRAILIAAGEFGAALLAEQALLPLLEGPIGVGRFVVRGTYAPAFAWRAQTPQAARLPLLIEAYERARAEGFVGTDTAAVIAHSAHRIRIVPAGEANPKVTVPADLAVAEELLKNRLRPR